MQLLLIAVSFGFDGHPFTTSTTVDSTTVDHNDRNACRDYLCSDKGLEPEMIDEVLVVFQDGAFDNLQVQHQYYPSYFDLFFPKKIT